MTTFRNLLTKISARKIGVMMSATTLAISAMSAINPATASDPVKQQSARTAKKAEVVADQLLVMAAGGTDKEEFGDSMEAIHGTVIKTIGEGMMTVYVVQTEKGKADEAQSKLTKDSHIASVQPNYRLRLQQGAPPAPVVNDPFFPSQPNLGQIQAPAAWKTSTGKGIVVGVIDSGVPTTGPEFAGKVQAGYDAVLNKNSQTPTGNHGTNVASVLGCATNNKTNGAAVAPDAVIFPMKICDPSGFISEAALLECIQVAGNRGVRILNISLNAAPPFSLSNPQYHQAFHTWADWYHNKKNGLLFLCSGSDGLADTSPLSPNIIVVTALNNRLEFSGISNRGKNVWFCAPGESILATNVDGRAVRVTGTSMAAPHVSGIAALMLSANRNLSNREVEQILIKTARRPNGTVHPQLTGYGVPNAAAAVYAAQHQLFFQLN